MPDESTQQQYIRLAWNAASKAKDLAYSAETAARNPDKRPQVAGLAAAGALWADVSRSYAAIAAVLPEPAIEGPADTDPGA